MAFLLSSAVSHALAEDRSDIRRSGDWEVICGKVTTSDAPSANLTVSSCRAVQRLTVEGTNDTVFMLTIIPGQKGSRVAIASIPLGGYLVPGVELTIDQGQPFKLLVETCTAAGCHAGFPLTGRVDKEMRSGQKAAFRIWTTKNKPTEINVSLNGLKDALAALERQP